MQKLKMHTPNITDRNIEKIAALFPNCITETLKKNELVRAIDFDQLKQELSSSPIVEGLHERYQLNWPGKHEALATANASISSTLRPCRDESINFDNTKNLFIEGDNLDGLKLLQEPYLNRIKIIYIDPPYNTGKDFIYKDNFTSKTTEYNLITSQLDEEKNRMIINPESNGRFHSNWLSMMYGRLKLAKNLLCNDGAIFISIDDHEVHNLRKICDEIFGASNYICSIMWKRKKEISNDAKNIAIQGEYIVVYSKSNDTAFKLNKLSDDYIEKSYRAPSELFPDGKWRPVPITVSKGLKGGGYKYQIVTPSGKKHERIWAYPENSFKELERKHRIYYGEDGSGIPQRVIYAHESKGQPVTNFWDDIVSNKEGKKEILELFGENYFDTPKPTKLIMNIIDLLATEESIILDFFAGSSTTADAVMQLNQLDGGKRQFIMMQLPEVCNIGSEAAKAGYKTIADISKERIRRAGNRIKKISENKFNTDIGFRVLKLDESNIKEVSCSATSINQKDLSEHVENIKPGRGSEDLLFQVLLDWGIDLTLPIHKKIVCSKDVFFILNRDANALIACFDKDITEQLAKELANYKPEKIVFRDMSFGTDSLKINIEQIFKHLSPNTEIRVL